MQSDGQNCTTCVAVPGNQHGFARKFPDRGKRILVIGGVSHPIIFQLAGGMRPATHHMVGASSRGYRFDIAVIVAMVSALVAGISLITGASAFGQEGPAPLFTARPAPIGGLDLNVQFQTEIEADRSAPPLIESGSWVQEPGLALTPFSLALDTASTVSYTHLTLPTNREV